MLGGTPPPPVPGGQRELATGAGGFTHRVEPCKAPRMAQNKMAGLPGPESTTAVSVEAAASENAALWMAGGYILGHRIGAVLFEHRKTTKDAERAVDQFCVREYGERPDLVEFHSTHDGADEFVRHHRAAFAADLLAGRAVR